MIRAYRPSTRGPGPTPRTAFLAVAALAAAWAATSCIDRSNPFDPINAGDARIQEVRNQLKPGLDSLAAGKENYGPKLALYDSVFRSDSAANFTTSMNNEAHKKTNSSTAKNNAAVTEYNATAPLDSLQPQQAYLTVDSLKPYGPYADFDAKQSALGEQAAKLGQFMSQANADHAPAAIYPAVFSDSVLAPFRQDMADFAGLRARIDAGNRQVSAYNSALAAFSALLDSNKRISFYNDSITFLKQSWNRPVYARADSLDAGTKAAKAGDTLFIGKGALSVDLRFFQSGTLDKPIVVRGYPGGNTILRAPAGGASAMTLSQNRFILFQDIVFRGGVQIVAGSSDITFRGCTFDSSSTTGLKVANSGVALTDCRLLGNGVGLSFLGDTTSLSLNLRNVLLARNASHGLVLVDAKGEVNNCTLADNGGDGINMKIRFSALSISNSIISGNAGVGVYRQRNTELQDQPLVKQCDVWGNTGGDWSLAGLTSAAMDQMKSTDYDIAPVFADTARFDYGLQPGSKLAELEHQAQFPIVIGYRP